MSTNRRSDPGRLTPAGDRFGTEHERVEGGDRQCGEARGPHAYQASGAPQTPGPSRRKRRRQRSQRGKHGRPATTRPAHTDAVSREHIFQDIEGLLRQIREQAEESTNWSEQQLHEITRTVTSFTRALEEEADPISDRARNEYHRVRDKLSQAIRGN
jgi:hypothetical protein